MALVLNGSYSKASYKIAADEHFQFFADLRN